MLSTGNVNQLKMKINLTYFQGEVLYTQLGQKQTLIIMFVSFILSDETEDKERMWKNACLANEENIYLFL